MEFDTEVEVECPKCNHKFTANVTVNYEPEPPDEP